MTLQIIGIPQSNFVRAVRMVAEEKGVEYELIDTAPHAEDIKVISPTGKVPGMRHAQSQHTGASLAPPLAERRIPWPSGWYFPLPVSTLASQKASEVMVEVEKKFLDSRHTI